MSFGYSAVRCGFCPLTVDRSRGGSDSRYSTEWHTMRSANRAQTDYHFRTRTASSPPWGVCVCVWKEGGETGRRE